MKRVIKTSGAPAAIGPYSQAIEANGTGEVPSTIEEQVEQCFANIKAILNEAGYTFDDVVKSVVLLDDLANFNVMNDIYAKYYTKDMPARVCYQVCKLPKGVKVEIDTTAVK